MKNLHKLFLAKDKLNLTFFICIVNYFHKLYLRTYKNKFKNFINTDISCFIKLFSTV